MKFSLLILAWFVSVDASARVLIGKNMLSTYPLAHKQNVFEYQIVNIGNTSAINVELHDRDSFPTDRFEILKGSPNTKFAEIPPQMTVYHHVVVVPRNVQPIEDKNVTVDYTDSETKQVSHVSTLWYSKGRFTHYLHEDALKAVIGTSSKPFLGFAAIALPFTALSSLFYFRSKSRYSVTKQN
ncbi:hypothetical protein CRE_29892 [Caenorhabditis remanei]|uniref:Translocon-associated protein subunit beta n=1 Tax=Caenorhabditis remanei TaxID=31234 RepID=E3MM20_CAERE|nr:hypothetical protein CRE_29892 [Caenorhabditis remanei]